MYIELQLPESTNIRENKARQEQIWPEGNEMKGEGEKI
jgi:hypothetical protein